MKKILSIILAASVAFALLSFAACEKKTGGASALTGTPEEIMSALLEKAATLVTDEYGMPMTFEYAVTAETSQSDFGLSATDFEKYIESATASKGALMTTAHVVTLVKLKNAADATTVKALVAKGFDSTQWICVFPEESTVIESGAYILLIASKADWSNAILTAFQALAVNYGEANKFFTGPEGGGDLGLLLG